MHTGEEGPQLSWLDKPSAIRVSSAVSARNSAMLGGPVSLSKRVSTASSCWGSVQLLVPPEQFIHLAG
jgi:hypothetical protein